MTVLLCGKSCRLPVVGKFTDVVGDECAAHELLDSSIIGFVVVAKGVHVDQNVDELSRATAKQLLEGRVATTLLVASDFVPVDDGLPRQVSLGDFDLKQAGVTTLQSAAYLRVHPRFEVVLPALLAIDVAAQRRIADGASHAGVPARWTHLSVGLRVPSSHTKVQ